MKISNYDNNFILMIPLPKGIFKKKSVTERSLSVIINQQLHPLALLSIRLIGLFGVYSMINFKI